MGMSFDKAMGIHPQAVLVRAERAGLLADNLANADTPHYKARDIDFRAVLAEQAAADRFEGVRRTHAGHLADDTLTLGGYDLKYRVPLQPALDGNTVDTQLEQGAFMSNAVRYQVSLEFLNRKVKGLKAALKGE